MRHISVIKNLPVNQLTDEEIVKAVMNHLNCRMVMLVYQDNNVTQCLYRWKNARGKWLCQTLIHLWNSYFKNPKRVTRYE